MPAQPLATPAPSSEPTSDGRCSLQRRQPIAESDYDCFAKRINVNHEHVAPPTGLKVDSAACGDTPDAGGTHRNACEQIYCFDWPDVLYRSVATDESPCIRQDAASSRSNSPISRSASPRHRLQRSRARRRNLHVLRECTAMGRHAPRTSAQVIAHITVMLALCLKCDRMTYVVCEQAAH